jgi:hypothetical protein
MSKTEATQAQADTIAAGNRDDDDDDFFYGGGRRKRDEARAKACVADPVGAMRKRVEADIAFTRGSIACLNADLRVARLELKAAEACLLALGPVAVVDEAPAPKKATKPAPRRAGKAG